MVNKNEMTKRVCKPEGDMCFFKKAPIRVLMALRSNNKCGSELIRNIDGTYCHMVSILHSFEKMGLIVYEKKGRIKKIILTKDGKEIIEKVDDIQNIINKGKLKNER